MPSPFVSILMPAYNSERYVKEAIDSVLNQTFSDFEFLIINDGSTDATAQIIQSYNDNRIVYIENETNLGLIDTLNKGFELVRGKYIARMDADDICLPNRLQQQVDWFARRPSVSVVGCHIALINEKGEAAGQWKDDLKTETYEQVKSRMAWANCMAHPTVMMRSDISRHYRFQPNQKNTEDYDLWLRLLADGITIEKVPEKLLRYRVHEASVTGSILRKTNPFLKQYNCKRRFLTQRMKDKKWGLFETKVLLTMMHNGIMGVGKNIKAGMQS